MFQFYVLMRILCTNSWKLMFWFFCDAPKETCDTQMCRDTMVEILCLGYSKRFEYLYHLLKTVVKIFKIKNERQDFNLLLLGANSSMVKISHIQEMLKNVVSNFTCELLYCLLLEIKIRHKMLLCIPLRKKKSVGITSK